MKKTTVKKCKYPKCNKEIYKKHTLFCLEHSRKMKENGKKAGEVLAVAIVTVPIAFRTATNIIKRIKK
ncbi:hypothetical protein KIJ04_09045 [Leuconostoc gelidum subsp. gelidum]|uniref:hypothetical protein n=1 Tax=Leuconostoc gelidum TaxID=1244 RepID=UPI001CC7E8D0|nr:hypothetical protein [Leuconostoc gelidum]MBZ6014879.1 hypothetical protein [Leuconostoc gelidum subsp. gelidum]